MSNSSNKSSESAAPAKAAPSACEDGEKPQIQVSDGSGKPEQDSTRKNSLASDLSKDGSKLSSSGSRLSEAASRLSEAASKLSDAASKLTSKSDTSMMSGVTRRGSQTLAVPPTAKPPRRLSLGPEPPDERAETEATEDSRSLLSPSRNSLWSEIEDLEQRRGSNLPPAVDGDTDPGREDVSNISHLVADQLRDLARRFSLRTERFKEKTVQPPTPSTDGEDKSAISAVTDDSKEPDKERKIRLDSIAPSPEDEVLKYWDFKCCKIKRGNTWKHMPKLTDAIEPQSKLYVVWLSFVAIAYLYNAAAIPLRAAFRRAYFYEGYVPSSEQTRVNSLSIADPCDGLNDTTCSAVTTVMMDAMSTVMTSLMENVTTAPQPTVQRYYYEGVETDENRWVWWICDYTADLLYILDIIFVKTRIKFIRNGMLVDDIKETARTYFKSEEFKFDLGSLFPGEILYLIPAIDYSTLCRVPRLLKIKTYWEFFDRLDQVAKSGHLIRVLRTLMYMLFLIHVESCGYYSMSSYEGLALNEWVYNGQGIAYVRCMYLATKTATSIGNNPKPQNQEEWLFMTAYWLSGVFVFAMLIGQIRDIFQSAGAAKTNYRSVMDNTLNYMQSLNLPPQLQGKVRTWFNYNWETQKTLNENRLLDALPSRLRTDMALYVHLETLNKVSLFQDCEKNLLYELVIKLEPVTYTPGDYICKKDCDKNLIYDLVTKLKPVLMLPMDYICKKGEVGTEMYIVKQGQVEVVGGENDSIVFVTLHEGSVFGEISLLAIGGANRRTANVRSKGFSNLFILSKTDFEAAMRDYPEAYRILKKKAKKVLNKNKKIQSSKMEAEEVIKKGATPKLLKTVVQVVNPESKLHAYIKSAGNTPRPSVNLSLKDEEVEQLQELQLQDTLNEEDEVLIVETTEQPLTPDSLAELEKEGRLSRGSVESEERLRLLPRGGRDSVDSAVDSIMNSPLDMASKTRRMIGSKVHPAPADVTFEDEEVTKSRPPSRGWKKSCKVAPLVEDNKTPVQSVTIPPENRVTCNVEIHREKTPSVSSPRGVDNPAFEEEKNNETSV